VTFFDPHTDGLALDAQAKYYAYLASTGITGLVVLGTNAETMLLTREERRILLETARASVPPGYPIVAGVSGHSTAQVLEYIGDAHAAGADYALVLPAAYFAKQTTESVVRGFFRDVASQSPIPVIIYNFPGVTNGLDLDSDVIAAIARENANVVGVKLTCGSVAKITRLAAAFPPDRLAVFGGQSDFLLGGLVAGSAGCIAAFGNVFPKAVSRIYDLWVSGRRDEALRLQRELAVAEAPTKAGVACTKYAAAVFTGPRAGISDAVALLRPRRPYEEVSESVKARIRNVMAAMDREEDRIGVKGRSRL
jgi:dihydrodipicolinate synthase/N-acetylneuraminate lyase